MINMCTITASDAQESDSPMSVNQMDCPPVFSELTDFSAGSLLYWASCACSLTDMVEALAHGADANWVNAEDNNRTPLMQAVQGVRASVYLINQIGSAALSLCVSACVQGSLITCEFLLQNAANVDQQDIRGRGPLHHATILGHTG